MGQSLAESKRQQDRKRPTANQRGYNGKWQRQRKSYLTRHPYCAMCKTALATVVDHIEAHRGRKEVFQDQQNWQSLCSFCHNSVKKRQENADGSYDKEWEE